jgi:hypothetical protein
MGGGSNVDRETESGERRAVMRLCIKKVEDGQLGVSAACAESHLVTFIESKVAEINLDYRILLLRNPFGTQSPLPCRKQKIQVSLILRRLPANLEFLPITSAAPLFGRRLEVRRPRAASPGQRVPNPVERKRTK